MFEFVGSLDSFFQCVGDINCQISHVRFDGLDYIAWYHSDGIVIDLKHIGSSSFIDVDKDSQEAIMINSYLFEKFDRE